MKTRSTPRIFRLHFNRNNMRQGSQAVWTIHLSNECIAAREVDVQVPVKTIYNPSGRQPRAYLKGKGRIIDGIDGHYTIIP